jgi:hypothetical protein
MEVSDMKITIAALATLLVGCVSTTDVVPVGKDSYLISGRANGGLNAGKGTIQATQKANAYCASQNKFMIVRRIDTNGNAAVFGESASLYFSCVTQDDPEYQRPNLRRDPTEVIEDQRQH